MTPTEFPLYAQIFVTAICAIAYVMTYRYQSSKLDTMDRTVKNLTDLISGQSKIIADFDRYKSIFDIADFEKRLAFKLENKEIEMNKQFSKRLDGIYENTVSLEENITSTNALFKTEYRKVFYEWGELAEDVIWEAISKFPTSDDKQKRDQYYQEKYPKNSNYFISVTDEFLSKRTITTNHSQ